jgi:hypothetical protein
VRPVRAPPTAPRPSQRPPTPSPSPTDSACMRTNGAIAPTPRRAPTIGSRRVPGPTPPPTPPAPKSWTPRGSTGTIG